MGTSTYGHLGKSERAWVLAHPFDAMKINEAKRVAILETLRRFPGGQHNTPADAFRHCYWSALVTSRIGESKAREFTTWHEAKPNNPFCEWRMDIANNAVGIEIGRRGGNDAQLAKACFEALQQGRLWSYRC